MESTELAAMRDVMHRQHAAIYKALRELPEDAYTSQPLLYVALSGACSAQSTACDALHVLHTVLRETPAPAPATRKDSQ